MSEATVVEPAAPTVEPTTDTDTRTRKQPPYAVVLHNDDINGFEYVVRVLQRVFGYAEQKAYQLTLQAHRTGRSIVWSGSLEVAELKADQIRSCGPDPAQASAGAGPLRVSVEAMPG